MLEERKKERKRDYKIVGLWTGDQKVCSQKFGKNSITEECQAVNQ